MAHAAGDPDRQGEGEEDEAVSSARGLRQLGDFLRDADLKRIDRAEGGAHGGGADANRGGSECVEAQALGEEQQGGNEGNDLLLHVFRGASGGECQRDDRDGEQSIVAQPPYQPVDAVAQGARPIDDRERPADEEHEEHHRRSVDQTAWDRDHGVERAERMRGYAVVRARHDDGATGHRVVPLLVPTGREYVGQRGGDERAADEQRERAWRPDQARRCASRRESPRAGAYTRVSRAHHARLSGG